MPSLNPALERFQPSPIGEIFSLCTRLKAEGRDIIDLSIGEPDFMTPDHIKESAIEAIHSNVTKYTNSAGSIALREAVCEKFKRENHLDYEPHQVLIDSGVKPLLFHAIQAMVASGDEVIIPVPCWASYTGMVQLGGSIPVLVPCLQEHGFKLQAKDLEAAITDKTRLILLNSPSNPTGAAYNATEMKALTDVLLRHPEVWVLADDIYEHIVFGNFVTANPAQVEPKLYDRTITLNGVSKAYAMTGWRIGYAAGPEGLIKAVLKIMSQSTGCASSVSQAAALCALSGPQDFLRERAGIYQQRRDFLVERLNGIKGITCHAPEGAFYLYPSCEGLLGKSTPDGEHITDSTAVVKYFLDQAGVAVVPGCAFEYDPNFRLSYAASLDSLKLACDRIDRACSALN